MFKNYMSTKEASHKWGVTMRHVAELCTTKRIRCPTLGREWIIDADQDYQEHMKQPQKSRKT